MKNAIIVLGTSPSDEACAQVGDANYAKRSRSECEAFRRQIHRHYPLPAGLEMQAGLGIVSNPHEHGTCRVVDIAYDPFSVSAATWASQVASDPKGLLSHWDEEARKELGLQEAVMA